MATTTDNNIAFTLRDNLQQMLYTKVRQLLRDVGFPYMSFNVDMTAAAVGSITFDFTNPADLTNSMICVQRTSPNDDALTFYHTLGDTISASNTMTCAIYALLAVMLFDVAFAVSINNAFSALNINNNIQSCTL